MPEWTIQHRTHDGSIVAEFKPADTINLSINKNTPSSATYSIARSDPLLTRDGFAPYRTDCFIYRDGDLIISGPHTSRSWDSEQEGTIEVAMLDWSHLLEKLYFPVPLEVGDQNIDFYTRKTAGIQYGSIENPGFEALDVIVREVLEQRNILDDIQWSVYVMPSGGNVPVFAPFNIWALDGQTMMDMIKSLSEFDQGFDFDVVYLGTNDLRVRLWSPSRDELLPSVYFSDSEQFSTFKWTDAGPIAARTFGTAQGQGTVTQLADVSTYGPSETVYRALEITENFADLTDAYQYNTGIDAEDHIIRRRTGTAGNKNRAPQHTVECSFLTSVLGFNFWTQMPPGVRINIDLDFGFHRVDADYLLLGYNATINAQGDEMIEPDLQRVPDFA